MSEAAQRAALAFITKPQRTVTLSLMFYFQEVKSTLTLADARFDFPNLRTFPAKVENIEILWVGGKKWELGAVQKFRTQPLCSGNIWSSDGSSDSKPRVNFKNASARSRVAA